MVARRESIRCLCVFFFRLLRRAAFTSMVYFHKNHLVVILVGGESSVNNVHRTLLEAVHCACHQHKRIRYLLYIARSFQRSPCHFGVQWRVLHAEYVRSRRRGDEAGCDGIDADVVACVGVRVAPGQSNNTCKLVRACSSTMSSKLCVALLMLHPPCFEAA